MTQDDRDMLIRVDAGMADIMKLVKGNGQPGLVQRVGSLELWRSMLVGAWLLAIAVVSIYAAVKK